MDTQPDPRTQPHDLPDGCAQPVLIPDRFTYAEPGADFLGAVIHANPVAYAGGDLDALADTARALAHPHERPHADDHRGPGTGDTLPIHVDTLDTRPRAIGRAAGIDVGPAPDRHPSRAQRIADIRRDLELGTD